MSIIRTTQLLFLVLAIVRSVVCRNAPGHQPHLEPPENAARQAPRAMALTLPIVPAKVGEVPPDHAIRIC